MTKISLILCFFNTSGVYGLEVKCSASHAKGTGFEPRSVHACFSVIRPAVLIFPSSLHVKDPLLVQELGQSSKISKIKSTPFGMINKNTMKIGLNRGRKKVRIA